MAKTASLPAGAGKGFAELRSRLWFVFLALLVYRIGAHIPVPGINPDRLAALFDQNQGTILSLFNMFSGGALERMSIFALGIMPYISASIIMQLMTAVSPQLEQLKKEGEAGRRKISQYTRYGTVVLALVQGFGISVGLASQGVTFNDSFSFHFVAVVSFVCGAVFMMWLGEQITERGVGNGISLLIFAGIVAGLPGAIGQTLEQARNGEMSLLVVLGIGVLAIAVVGFVVFMERGQRRLTINYAKRQQGRRVFAQQSSHLPLKVNMAGVIPPIFASYIILFAAAVVFFCFFYTALMYNPKEVADNLKRSGAFIPGIRPGEQTAKYIDGVLTRLTLFGAMYIAAVSLFPQFLMVAGNVPFYLGGTSLLIVVVVVMDFMAQVQSHLMSHQYESLMKKSNLKGYGRNG
jgi:preprotein translocase subunit SecY